MEHEPSPPPIVRPPQPSPGLPNQANWPSSSDGLMHPNSEERSLGMMMHLMSLLTGFIGPLVLWLVKKEESAFLDHHGKESLNFCLSILVYSVSFLGITLVVGLVTFGIGLFVLMPLYFAFAVAIWIFEIIACIRAYEGSWYRFPLTIRFLR